VLAGGIAREFGNRQCAWMRRQNGHKGGHFALFPGDSRNGQTRT
jgi:hypothetical protein